MKAQNLQILKQNGFLVPNFIVVGEADSIDLQFSKCDLFAIRSSYDEEDSKQFSFAGQFKTKLNVPRNQIEAAVNEVRNSIFCNGVNHYKQEAIKLTTDKMKVIIQEMVESHYSGVMFTANPMGILNEMVIVVGNGLGDQVVEDKTQVTTYYYNTNDQRFYYEKETESPILSLQLLQELVRQAKQIETIYGQKMDIEFAIKNETVYILQARPITTFDPMAEEIVLDNSNIVESYPGISLPLTQSFVKEVYYKVFRSCLMRLTKSKKQVQSVDSLLRNMVDTANGRIYYRISNWYDVLRFLPCSSKIIPIWQEMLGVEQKTVTSATKKKITWTIKVRVFISFLNLLITNPQKMNQLNEYFAKRLPDYRKRIKKAKTKKELQRLFEQLKEDLSKKWDITLVNDMYTFLFTAMAKKRYKEQLSDLKELESMKPVRALQMLTRTATKYGFDSKEYKKKEKRYLDVYGDRCLGELKLETETYRTNPTKLYSYIKTQQVQSNEPAFHKREQMLKQEKKEPFFVKKARIGIMNREISRMNRSRIFGMAREILLKMAELLQQNGQIDDKRDIFYLFYEEVVEALQSGVKYQSVVEERKKEYCMFETLPDYSRLIFSGRITHKRIQHLYKEEEMGKTKCMYGTPCSNGIVVNEVIVIEEPNDCMDTTNKIIVTKMTDPGWVLLIHKAAGIIVEKGSLLSHTAIITRELKKPCVTGVKHCTTTLRTGDLVELNGTKGTIRIIKEGNG